MYKENNQPESPEALYAEHKETTARIEELKEGKDKALAHIAFLGENPGDSYSDRLDRNGLMEDISDYNLNIAVAESKYTDNLAQSKTHLKENPDQYQK